MKMEELPTDQKTPMPTRMIVLLLALAVAWLLWSGLFKPLLLGFGLFSCALTFWLARRMGYFETDIFALRFSFRLMAYWAWLGREIFLSSLQVARVVLAPKLTVSPTVIEIKPTAQRPFEQVIFGNSITLTPGTLTLDLYEGIIKVHCLTEAGAKDLLSGDMDRRVARLQDD